ncbi:hypothetical protein CAPTEDRAFT_77234, partial [Capitella teleta]
LVSGETFVPDNRMTASSEWSEFHGPQRARMDAVKEGLFNGGWVAQTWSSNQWIQVEFDEPMLVQKVKTKGRDDYTQWVESYLLLFGLDGQQWETYQEPFGTDKVLVFTGNTDNITPVEHSLLAPVKAKFVRFQVQTWSANGIGFRLELFG